MNAALVACMQTPPTTPAMVEVNDWWRLRQSLEPLGTDPVARSITGGFAADRVGWAFASGYQAALRALLPDLPRGTLAAMCVTEAKGNHPRHIQTTITPRMDGTLRLDGAKLWITLGASSSLLLVVGRMTPAPGETRPALRLAFVPVPTDGLVFEPMAPARFVPEVPHVKVSMRDLRVPAGALMPGDGYDAYVKPFRTVEDLYVTLSVLAYLLREARARDWPAGFKEELVATMHLLSQLAGEDLHAPSMHVALAGALHAAHRLYTAAQPLWAACGDDPSARRWQRDVALFEIAGSARRQRAERAWERLGETPASRVLNHGSAP
jgi:acyl-CoA dehydrogenase